MRSSHQLKEQAAQLRSRAASFRGFGYYASAAAMVKRAEWLEDQAQHRAAVEVEARCLTELGVAGHPEP